MLDSISNDEGSGGGGGGGGGGLVPLLRNFYVHLRSVFVIEQNRLDFILGSRHV